MKNIYLFLFVCFITNFALAQDYLISFSGTGESNTVASVKVENLTQNKSLTLNGSDVLHLKKVVTGISDMISPDYQNIRFYPNPALDYSLLEFNLIEEGTVRTDLFDISGRVILQKSEYLTRGLHSYRFSGLGQGIYVVRITSGAQFLSGKLVCEKPLNGNLGIELNESLTLERSENTLKSANGEISMQYNTGDILKYTGISGKYKTVVADIPTGNKTIGFSFYSCSDNDGKDYSILKIGTQWWMAENLQTTKYKDGTAIPNVTVAGTWSALTTGSYCWYNNNAATYQNTYGALYNWYAVNTGKLCPTGWHVPSDAEWTTLENYLIVSGYNYDGTTTGNKIAKSLAATTNWSSNSGAGTIGNNLSLNNKTGFSALPGGNIDYGGSFYNIGNYGNWWSSTEFNGSNAWNRGLGYHDANVHRNNFSKTYGFGVRCVKDAATGNNTILIDTLINASASDVIITVKNKIKVVIPKGTVLSNSRLTIEEEPESNYTKLDIFKTHFIYNVKIAGQTTFNKPLIITFNYNPAKLETGWTKDRLTPAYYNDTLKTWISYPGAVVDSVLNQITFTTNHLTPLTLTELMASFGYQHKFENEHFIVYYTYQGTHKVCDNDTYDSPSQPWHITEGPEKNTPFYIQDLAHWLNNSWAAYDRMGFSFPEEKIKVYVTNLGGSYGQIGTLTGWFYINNDVGTDDSNKDFTRSILLQGTVAHEMLHFVQGEFNAMVRAATNYQWWLEALATQGDRMVWGSALQHYETEFFCNKVTNARGNVLCHSLAFSWDKAIDWDWYAAGGFLAYLTNYRTGTKLNLFEAIIAGEEASNRNYIDNEIRTKMGGTGIGTEYLNYVQWLYEKRHDRQQLPTIQYSDDNPMVLDATLTKSKNTKKFSESSMPYLSTRLIKIKNTDIIENPEFEITISKPNPEIRIFLCAYANKKFSITAELHDKDKRNLSVIVNTSQFDILIVNTSKDNDLPFDITIAPKKELVATLGNYDDLYSLPKQDVSHSNFKITRTPTSIIYKIVTGGYTYNAEIIWKLPPTGEFSLMPKDTIFMKQIITVNLSVYSNNGEPANINASTITVAAGLPDGLAGGYFDSQQPLEPTFGLNAKTLVMTTRDASTTLEFPIKISDTPFSHALGDGMLTFSVSIKGFAPSNWDISVKQVYFYKD